jgi:CRISPR/Cas system CSM-associated protein Csm3 (group 7 of RAMP superfamily)
MNKRTEHRSILERWVITGKLLLETPAHFGNGDADPLTDMPLLLDEVEGRPLLPGSSVAGALRSYLREREYGYGIAEAKGSGTSLLFGSIRVTDEDGTQSPLIINDALGTSTGFELRNGVAIDPETRTALDKKKYDMQLLAAGSSFDLRFELVVCKDADPQKLRDALFTALYGLQKSKITLGARKRRGFGYVSVTDWQVFKFNLQTKGGLVNWLGFDQGLRKPTAETGDSLAAKLGVTLTDEDLKEKDQRLSAHLAATFAIDGTLMIRSGFGDANSPDTVHIRSVRSGKSVPVIPGTSLAGALRQRALKITRTLAPDHDKVNAQKFVDDMFGPAEIKADEKHAKASRVMVKETEIKDTTQLVMTRVKIDRFTGGAYESALFSEQPEIGEPNRESVTLDLTLSSPTDAELGLLLLLLKDLWTGDLPIGGESSVGRGRLKGIQAKLTYGNREWTFKANGENVEVTPDADELEKWVGAFNKKVQKAQVSDE